MFSLICFQSSRIRLDAAIENPSKEAEKLQQLQKVSLPFYQACDEAETYSKPLQVFHILLEEYRISLFAQNLGTKQKVSDVRILKAWEQVFLGNWGLSESP